MPTRSEKKKENPIGYPARTLEGQENKVISKAMKLAEKQISDGTASAQVISHFLKLGSTREQLEQERLMRENELLRARVEQLASGRRVEELYQDALNAMRIYSGQEPVDYSEEGEYND